MWKPSTLVFLLIKVQISSTFSFHENTHVVFRPEYGAEYFGYSTLLSNNWMIVGAPKAKETVNSNIHPGAVFNCSLENLSLKNVTCYTLDNSEHYNKDYMFRRYLSADFWKDDMWFGASMALLSKDKLLINAPRWTSPFGNKHLLMNGISWVRTSRSSRTYYPLKDYKHQAYVTNGSRKDYGEYGTHLNYYAYGESGFSVAVTKKNTFLIGAPGLLQWTGGVSSYSFIPNDTSTYLFKFQTANPYYTKDIGPDDYFGYSVASGTFVAGDDILYIAGAPRANMAEGQVLLYEQPTQELKALNIKAKIKGTQHGAYFGASLCCTDINGDGLDDLLVGAPTYVNKNDGLPFDQGAVFVYMTRKSDAGFILEESGYVSGSEANGAWFGIAIADLGDIDDDGFRDVAVGAPRENEGKGAVYIYKGYNKGLRADNVQRLQPKDGMGFGWSLAGGVDVDNNNCNDLAVGAIDSQTAYIYRSIPTMRVQASIKVPDALNLPQNSTNFTAVFCVSAPSVKHKSHLEIGIIAAIEVDKGDQRAMISGASKYTVRVSPGKEFCDEQVIEVNPLADLTKPISLSLHLTPDELIKENATTFLMNAARLSEDSILKSSFLIQLVRDCGEDLICTPWLDMTMEPLDNPYIPGTNTKLGAKITILNKEEPAYAVKVNFTLPMTLKRIPSDCSLQDLTMVCDVPAPLLRNTDVVWEIELDYNLNLTKNITVNIKAEISDVLFRNISDEPKKELAIDVTPVVDFRISGKSMPNVTIPISRQNLNGGTNITFKHYFEITNLGPSDWPALIVHIILLSERVNVTEPITGCESEGNVFKCVWSVPAKVSFPVYIPLIMDLSKQREFIKANNTFNVTTDVILINQLKMKYSRFPITTKFKLEPESHLWMIILACVGVGLLILAFIVKWLQGRGFFLRPTHTLLRVQKDQEQNLLPDSDNSVSNEEQIENEEIGEED